MIDLSNISVLAYANNFTLWHYTTSDPDVLERGYFDNAHELLRAGDLIIANYSTDSTPLTKFLIVAGNKDGHVTVKIYV